MSATMITVHLRYEIDADKLDDFTEYARPGSGSSIGSAARTTATSCRARATAMRRSRSSPSPRSRPTSEYRQPRATIRSA